MGGHAGYAIRLIRLERVTRGFLLAGRHQDGAAGLSREPAGQTDMIDMVMRDNQALESCLPTDEREYFLPVLPAFRIVDAGINRRPSIVFAEEIDIDVIELERQRQSHPPEALGDFMGLTERQAFREGGARHGQGFRISRGGEAAPAVASALAPNERQGYPIKV